jgi:hypothetical protein
MRRIIGLVLAGVGTFLIVIAILLPTWVVSTIMKFPLNEYETATLTGTNIQYFSTHFLTEETGVTMRATYTIKGVKNQGNGSTAVWKEFSSTYDVTNGTQYQYTVRQAAFDRKTGQLTNCCGSNINGNTGIKQTGYVGWVFPFGTQKKTYMVFDTTLDKPEPYVFSGTDVTDGVPTYKFVENITPTQFGTQVVPGYFVGANSPTATAGEFYQSHIVYWVDPETGALLNVNEFEEVSLHNLSTGQAGLVAFKGDLTETPASLHQIVGLDAGGRNELSLLQTILPLVLGIAGALALVAGILLRWFGGGQTGSVMADAESGELSPPTEPIAFPASPGTSESETPIQE